MKLQTVLIGASGALAILGCSSMNSKTLVPKYLTVGPDYEKPTNAIPLSAMPDAGQPTTNVTADGAFRPAASNEDMRIRITADSIRRWWANFNDPILNGLVESAVSNNLSFLMAQKRLEQARWQLLGSASPLLPQISADGGWTAGEHERYTSSQYSTWKSKGSKRSYSDLYRAGFDATWEIDVFGGARRATEAAWATMEAANFTLADAWVSLTSEIGSSYITLRTTQERLAVARKNLALQSETYDILKSRLDSGIGDELAVNQARYNVEQTRAKIPTLLSEEETLLNAIAILAGTVPGMLHDELRGVTNRDWMLAPQRIDAIPLDTLRSRPDVQAVERKLAAQVASVGVATANLYPRFFINGTLGLESVKIQKFLNRGDFYGTIGPTFSWPIFQGGNIIANIRTEEAKMDEAYLAYELTMETAYRETRNAYSAYTQEYHRNQALAQAVKAASDAVAISRDLYKNGLSDFNNVLDAERSLLALEESFVISRGEITLDVIALYKALGGGVVIGE